MATRIFLKTLTRPLSPPVEARVRRVFGALQAVLACLIGGFAIRLVLELRREIGASLPSHGTSDAGGMAFAAVSYVLIPATVLLGFGSVSVWRKWSIPWWVPLLVMVSLAGAVRLWV
jgi:hypothetical protein